MIGIATWQKQSDYCNHELEESTVTNKIDCIGDPISEQNRDGLVLTL